MIPLFRNFTVISKLKIAKDVVLKPSKKLIDLLTLHRFRQSLQLRSGDRQIQRGATGAGQGGCQGQQRGIPLAEPVVLQVISARVPQVGVVVFDGQVLLADVVDDDAQVGVVRVEPLLREVHFRALPVLRPQVQFRMVFFTGTNKIL